MVGRKVVLEFPMACDRCGRTIRPGEEVMQRTYPTKTYVTHIVCKGVKRSKKTISTAGKRGRENTNNK